MSHDRMQENVNKDVDISSFSHSATAGETGYCYLYFLLSR